MLFEPLSICGCRIYYFGAIGYHTATCIGLCLERDGQPDFILGIFAIGLGAPVGENTVVLQELRV